MSNNYQELADRQYKLMLSMGWAPDEAKRSASEMVVRVAQRDTEKAKHAKGTVFTNLAPIMATVVELMREAGIDKGMRIEIAPKGEIFTISRGPAARDARKAGKPLPTRDWRASLADPTKKKHRKTAEAKAADMGLRFVTPE